MMPRRLGRSQPAPLAPSGAPAPKVRAADQAELRERRRKRLPVHYTGKNFRQSVEVCAVCRSVGVDVSRLPAPRAMRNEVEAVADAVAEVLSVAVGMIAGDRHQTAETRARTAQAVADLAVRPRVPNISDEQIISGSWVQALADWLAPYDGDVAALLDRALPPGHDGLRGSPSASERIERALRILDGAVRDLERRVPKAAARQALPSMADYNRQQRQRHDAERAQHTLAKLGAV